ncbi:MAG: permease-like cell division protein FtsX [Syntrophotaleaceae bacterium]
MFEHILYFSRRVARNIRQSPVLCSAAIGTVAVSLTIVAFFGIVVINVQKLAHFWSDEIQVVAYIDKEPENDRLAEWRSMIGRMPEVKAVIFVDRNEAFARFKQRLARDADLLDGFDASILPASLEISLKDGYRTRQGVEAVVQRLRQNPDFSDFSYGQDWLERFEAFLGLLRLAGLALGGFLLFAALFIVANTIKLTLYARRDELEIMALVGATPIFIKTPFLLEGAVQGVLGGVIALGGSFLLYQAFLQKGLGAFLLFSGGGEIQFLAPPHQGLLVLVGMLLGLFGSMLSLRKFVRI